MSYESRRTAELVEEIEGLRDALAIAEARIGQLEISAREPTPYTPAEEAFLVKWIAERPRTRPDLKRAAFELERQFGRTCSGEAVAWKLRQLQERGIAPQRTPTAAWRTARDATVCEMVEAGADAVAIAERLAAEFGEPVNVAATQARIAHLRLKGRLPKTAPEVLYAQRVRAARGATAARLARKAAARAAKL